MAKKACINYSTLVLLYYLAGGYFSYEADVREGIRLWLAVGMMYFSWALAIWYGVGALLQTGARLFDRITGAPASPARPARG